MSLETFVWHIIYGKQKPPEISKGRWIGMQLYCIARTEEFDCSLKEILNFHEHDKVSQS